MIFPVYRTELVLSQPETFARSSYLLGDQLQSFFTDEVAGSIAVGSQVISSSEVYKLGEISVEPPIERIYDILTENIFFAHVGVEDHGKNSIPDYVESPIDLKARGRFNDIDVSIAGLYYQSNKHVGWMNISPRLALFKTISDEDQRKMLGL
ncbi:MAG: hypothetical protein ABIP50_03020 [Candidatus Saccharimonadales bacterium]